MSIGGFTGFADEGTPIAVDPSIVLTQKQTTDLKAMVAKGDATAAFRLYLHYTIALQDEAEGEKWLIQAANLGHPTAQYNLARIYLDDPKRRDMEKAVMWLRKSGAQGFKKAADELQRIQQLGNPPKTGK